MSYGLGIVIEPGMPSFAPRYTELQVVQPNQHFGRDTTSDFGYDITYNDDILQMWLGTGPQLDGLGHIGDDDIFYNCNKGADFSYITGLTKPACPAQGYPCRAGCTSPELVGDRHQ